MLFRILIVEDEPLIALDLEEMLQEGGFEVIGTAADMPSALALAEQQRPDAATMDIRLRGGSDGVETACRLYREHGIRSLFISSHFEAKKRAAASDCNPIAFVSKPFQAVQVLRELAGAGFRSLPAVSSQS
ncbi:response regulator [Aureimonas psammosilenae]|uniref:response regulator n=1 Tax=Aureimonas psammosilenae TaxID=2495496 RepID=UPI001260C886|nr:response regulator [Aureimonas psammosilenae]